MYGNNSDLEHGLTWILDKKNYDIFTKWEQYLNDKRYRQLSPV